MPPFKQTEYKLQTSGLERFVSYPKAPSHVGVWWRRGKFPCVLVTAWGWILSLMLRPPCLWHLFSKTLGGTQSWCRHDGEKRYPSPFQESNSGRPAFSQSLFWLSCRPSVHSRVRFDTQHLSAIFYRVSRGPTCCYGLFTRLGYGSVKMTERQLEPHVLFALFPWSPNMKRPVQSSLSS
jgi:hypothetical protein